MADRDPPTRANRQFGALSFGLNGRRMDRIINRRCTDRGIADGETADVGRGGQIFLQQHRRHRQHVADVVKAVSRIVGGEKRCGIDLERNQVANRVGILGTIQPVGRRAAGIGFGFGSSIEGRFQVLRH